MPDAREKEERYRMQQTDMVASAILMTFPLEAKPGCFDRVVHNPPYSTLSGSRAFHEFDGNERGDDSSQPVGQKVAPQNSVRSHGPVSDAPDGDGDEQRDDESMKIKAERTALAAWTAA